MRSASSLRTSLALCLLLALGCEGGCFGTPPIAHLREASGLVERDHESAWAAAEIGDHFVLGDAIKTATRARAAVEFEAGGGLSIEERTLVRFLERPDAEAGFAVAFGDAQLGGGGVQFGLATIDPRSEIKVRRDGKGLRLAVAYGRAVVDDGRGGRRTLAAGEAMRVGTSTKAARVKRAVRIPKRKLAVMTAKGRVSVRKAGAKRFARLAETSTSGAGLEVQVEKGTVDVEREGAKATVIAPARLKLGGEEGVLLELESGRAEADAERESTAIGAPHATVEARAPGGRAKIAVRGRETAIASDGRGDVAVTSGKRAEILRSGESVRVTKAGSIEFDVDLPERAHFAIEAGESAVVHDRFAPTAIEIDFARACPEGGAVELDRQRAQGKSSAIVAATAGAHRYRVRCLGAKAPPREGRIVVVKDSASKPLPADAPRNLVSADGRNYTVLYQNLLPKLAFEWRSAPHAAGYLLTIAPGSGAPKQLESGQASIDLPSGALPEGTYEFWFQVAGEPQRHSERTRLTIDFDNAAPNVVIHAPEPRFPASDGKVRVRGAAAEGASVSIDGRPITLDRHRRFDAETPLVANRDGIAIRIQDRRGRVHYYVRRVDPR